MFLKKFTGGKLTDEEARRLFERIADHKWYVSERLGRDVGLKVAAVDYLENIHEDGKNSTKPGCRNFNLKVYENLSLTA